MRRCWIKYAGTVGLFLLLTITLVACGQGQQENEPGGEQGTGKAPTEPEQIVQEDESDDFVLQVVSEKDTYEVGEEVNLIAKLKYTGEEDEVTIAHAASPFWFDITENTRGIHIGYGMNEPLITTTLQQGEWHEEAYTKTGGYSDQDPDREFIEEFLKEDGFPAGEYTIEVTTDFSLGEDMTGDRYKLSTSIDIEVVE